MQSLSNSIRNVLEKDIGQLFDYEYLERWKTSIPTHCQTCQLWLTCRGGCRAASEQSGGNLYDADPLLKYYGLQWILNNYQIQNPINKILYMIYIMKEK